MQRYWTYGLLALVAIGLVPAGAFAQQSPTGQFQVTGSLLSMPKVSAGGTFDPSLADTPPGQPAWMSYSAVDPSPRWPGKNTRTITTRIARSDDGGSTWVDLGLQINGLKEVQLGGSRGGSWNNEVSSLVFDPVAPPEARWKLFWHHYLVVGTDGQFQNGWIAYKHAATPADLASAREIKLFGAMAYNHDNDKLDSATGSPLEGPPVVDVTKLDTGLSRCVALSEPGAMVTPGGLYVTVDCFLPKVSSVIGLLGMGLFGVKDQIILLKCAAPCHPARPDSWKYIGAVLTPDDADSYGYNSLSGTDLFTANGRIYLLASPVTNKPVGNAYNGCDLFRFKDLDTGTLERTGGHPTRLMKIHGDPDTFNGACTYQASVPKVGFLYGQITFAALPIFHIYATGPVQLPQ
jgi:hypothetical protein